HERRRRPVRLGQDVPAPGRQVGAGDEEGGRPPHPVHRGREGGQRRHPGQGADRHGPRQGRRPRHRQEHRRRRPSVQRLRGGRPRRDGAVAEHPRGGEREQGRHDRPVRPDHALIGRDGHGRDRDAARGDEAAAADRRRHHPPYRGRVITALDARRAVGVASALVSDTQCEPLIARTAKEYDEVRAARARGGQSERAGLEEARANGFAYDPSGKAPPPARPGVHSFGDWPLRDLRGSIDWTPFFRAWELAGNYPAILEDEVVGETARSLFQDAQAMLDRIIAEHWLTPRGTVGFWRCRREGDDVLVLAGNDWTRLPFLRQQVKKREGRANMCLADFIDPDGEDWIGGFAVAIHGLEPHLAPFKADNDDYSDILLKALVAP